MPNGEIEKDGFRASRAESWEDQAGFHLTERTLGPLEVFEAGENPRRIRTEARRMATEPFAWILKKENLEPNEWEDWSACRAIGKRKDLLSQGGTLKEELETLVARHGMTVAEVISGNFESGSRKELREKERKIRGISAECARNLGYNLEELKAAGVHLEQEERVELIGVLEEAENELLSFLWLHQGVSQILSVSTDKDQEAGLFGTRWEVRPSIFMLATIANMPSGVRGNEPFGDQISKALRAIYDVARGKAPLPRFLAEDPNWGSELAALGYAFRQVAGIERTRPFSDKSPYPQFRQPVKYLQQHALAFSVEDLAAGASLKDLTEEELRYHEKHEGGPVPDIRTFSAEILADPNLAENLRACQVAYYLFRWMRLDVENAMQPRADKVTEGDLYHTFMGIPVGANKWHVENNNMGGDMINALLWVGRSIEEGLRDKPRWAGSRGLIGVIPNMSLALTHFIWLTRETRDKKGEPEVQFLSLHQAIFEKEVVETDGTRRPFLLRDIPFDRIWFEDSEVDFFNQVLGTTDSKGQERMWSRFASSRKDVSTLKRLTEMYDVALFFKGFLKPEKGYREMLNNIRSASWQTEKAKGFELSNLLDLIANGLDAKREAPPMCDLIMANLNGSVLWEALPATGTLEHSKAYDRLETMKVHQDPIPPREAGMGSGELLSKEQQANYILQVLDTMFLTGVFPQPKFGKDEREWIESTRRATLCADMVAFVATHGIGLLPGDVPFLFSTDQEENKRSLDRIRRSHLYKPYDVITRDRVKEQFADFQRSREKWISGTVIDVLRKRGLNY